MDDGRLDRLAQRLGHAIDRRASLRGLLALTATLALGVAVPGGVPCVTCTGPETCGGGGESGVCGSDVDGKRFCVATVWCEAVDCTTNADCVAHGFGADSACVATGDLCDCAKGCAVVYPA